MTTPNHFMQGIVITMSLRLKWYWCLLAGLISIVPDIGRLFQSNTNDWNLFYRWAHETWYLYFMPFWNLHIAVDKLVHKSTGGMNEFYLPLETLTWILMGILIWQLRKKHLLEI